LERRGASNSCSFLVLSRRVCVFRKLLNFACVRALPRVWDWTQVRSNYCASFCLRREGDFFAYWKGIFLFGYWIPYLILTVQKIIQFLITSTVCSV
jgi:hypothetical protein